MFTPDTPGDMEENHCYGLVVTNCVQDLSGNPLSNRGERFIGAYDGDGVTYNSYNVFFTGTAETTAPSLVVVSPVLQATGVHPRVYPFVVFDEPLASGTVNSTNLFMKKQFDPVKIPVIVAPDPSLQVATYKPVASLLASTTYVVTVTTAVADVSGNNMASPQTSEFTVEARAIASISEV